MIRSILRFLGNIFKKICGFIFKAAKEIVLNAQAVVVLVLASTGLTMLLKELPFHYAMPAIFDGALFVPVLAVMIVFILAYSMTWGQYAEENI
jgi:hypothetical protein